MRRSRPFSTGLTWLGIEWDGEAVYQFRPRRAAPGGGRATSGRGPRHHCYASSGRTGADARGGKARGPRQTYDGAGAIRSG